MASTRTDQDTGARPELRAALEEIVGSGFTGASVRVRDARGEWAGSAGAAELGGAVRPPVDGHTRIGSNTKTFTAALLLRLVAEDLVGLDTPAAAYLPAYGLDERITVRMLLQHTSGLFNFTGEVAADGSVTPGIPVPYGTSARAWLDTRFTAHRPEDLVRLALSKPALFAPGTGWSYSNTNYVLVRLLIEGVTGRPFDEEMRRLVLTPLGLSGTSVPDGSPELPEPHAHAYYRYDGAGGPETIDVTRHDPSWVSTGGDMISTTADLATFVSALAGGALLPDALLAQMCAPRPTGIPAMGYGLGVFVQDAGPGVGPLITHNGGLAGYATFMFCTPGGGTTLTAALNAVDDAGLSIGPAVQAAQRRLVEVVFGGGTAAAG